MTTRYLAVLGAILASATPAVAQSLTGAGATFPNPIYTKWFDQVGFPLTDEMKHAIAVQAFPE